MRAGERHFVLLDGSWRVKGVHHNLVEHTYAKRVAVLEALNQYGTHSDLKVEFTWETLCGIMTPYYKVCNGKHPRLFRHAVTCIQCLAQGSVGHEVYLP